MLSFSNRTLKVIDLQTTKNTEGLKPSSENEHPPITHSNQANRLRSKMRGQSNRTGQEVLRGQTCSRADGPVDCVVKRVTKRKKDFQESET